MSLLLWVLPGRLLLSPLPHVKQNRLLMHVQLGRLLLRRSCKSLPSLLPLSLLLLLPLWPIPLLRGTMHKLKCFMQPDRKSTRLNASHANISYAVFCLKKKWAIYRATFLTGALKAHSLELLLTMESWLGVRFEHCAAAFFFLMKRRPTKSTLFPYPLPFR